VDLARDLIQLSGFDRDEIEIVFSGVRPGEKLYEELLNDEEVRRTLELDDFFCVLPAFKNVYQKIEYSYEGYLGREVAKPYNSAVEPAMTRDDLREYLRRNKIV